MYNVYHIIIILTYYIHKNICIFNNKYIIQTSKKVLKKEVIVRVDTEEEEEADEVPEVKETMKSKKKGNFISKQSLIEQLAAAKEQIKQQATTTAPNIPLPTSYPVNTPAVNVPSSSSNESTSGVYQHPSASTTPAAATPPPPSFMPPPSSIGLADINARLLAMHNMRQDLHRIQRAQETEEELLLYKYAVFGNGKI